MRPKRPYVARMDQVRIMRDGESAVVEYREADGAQVHLTIGPRIADMSDEDILEMHNAGIKAREAMAASYVHVAVEVPPGQPQVKHFKEGGYDVPRGDVLRCVVTSREGDRAWEPAVDIDGREYNWEEFGRMLLTWEGWGVRMVVVPEEELEKAPTIEVREPDDG